MAQFQGSLGPIQDLQPKRHSAQSEGAQEPSLCNVCARAFALFLGYSALVILFYAGLYAIGEGIYWAITGAWL